MRQTQNIEKKSLLDGGGARQTQNNEKESLSSRTIGCVDVSYDIACTWHLPCDPIVQALLPISSNCGQIPRDLYPALHADLRGQGIYRVRLKLGNKL